MEIYIENLLEINIIHSNYITIETNNYTIIHNNKYNYIIQGPGKVLAIAGDIENSVIKIFKDGYGNVGRGGLNATKVRKLINEYFNEDN